MNKKDKLINIGLIFPLIVLMISIFYYSFKGQSCPFEGCHLAENIIKIPEIILEILGFLYFLTLFIVYNFFKNHKLFKFLLVTGILFEMTIYSFEIYYHIFCPLCTCIVLSLLYLSFVEFGYYTLSVISILIGIFLITPLNKKTDIVIKSKYNLIYSEKCPHCKKVKEFLSSIKFKYKGYVIEKNKELIRFLKELNINEVPVLIFKKDNSKTIIIKGDKNIINFIKNKNANNNNKISEINYTTNKLFNNNSNSILNYILPSSTQDFQGCSLNKETPCK